MAKLNTANNILKICHGVELLQVFFIKDSVRLF